VNVFDLTVYFLTAIRISSIDDQFIVNPTRQQMQKSDLNSVVLVNQKDILVENNKISQLNITYNYV